MSAAGAAADLLDWLDRNNQAAVMQMVHQWLEQQDDRPVPIQVDVTSLMCDDMQLAMKVLHDTGEISEQVQLLINQQLAMTAAEPAAAVDMLDAEPPEPPTTRATLKMTTVPLPLMSCNDVQQQVVQLCRKDTAPSTRLACSVKAVVSGLTQPAQRVHSQRYLCPACSTLVDVPVHQNNLPCCGIYSKVSLQEDVTGRLMTPCQQLWVTDLSSATGRLTYSSSRQPMLVQVPEDQVGDWHLGAILQIIGHASLNLGGAGGSCSVQMHANTLHHLQPHCIWSLPAPCLTHFTEHQQQHPLQLQWDLLTDALGYEAVIDPHVAVALLLSAASVGCTPSHSQKQQQPVHQVNLLLVHEQDNPCTCRLLRQVAALLSPQSVALPVPLAEHVLPIAAAATEVSDELAPQAMYASLLLLANAGVAVAELPALTSKSRQQLLEALHQHLIPLPKGGHRHSPAMQVTATCWAAAPWQEVCRLSEDDCQRKPDKAAAAAAAKSNYSGFDLLIADNTIHEQDIFAGLISRPHSSSSDTQPPQTQPEQKHISATASLRCLITAAASAESPVLEEAAQSFLGKYFLLVRQALDNSSKVSKALLLASLVRSASAVARLHLSSTVRECPDAVVAVVLMEQTLSNKLGSTYPSLLELPLDLNPTNDRTLDEQVKLLHTIIRNTFKQHCNTVEELSADNAAGCFIHDDEDSGADDCGGGMGGGRG